MLFEAKSNMMEVSCPFWPLVLHCEEGQSKNYYGQHATNVSTEGQTHFQFSIYRIPFIDKESISDSSKGRNRTDDLDPGPASTNQH